MTVVALIKSPLRSVDRRAKGEVLGTAEGNIDGIRLMVTMTSDELHIGWVDRMGPAFVIELKPLIKAAVDEMEQLLGMDKGATR
jgi:hypothetical protein